MVARPEHLRSVPEGRRRRRGFYILPNLLTTGGLLAGVYSLVASLRGDFFLAPVAIMAANVFDVLDGRVARVTKTTSEFGSQYDSLADLVAFGVAPAILLYRFALEPWGSLGWLAAGLYVVCGALRLARFNVQRDDVPKRNFVGLPIPAAAEVIASSVLLYVYLFGSAPTQAAEVTRRFGWLLLSYALAILMVSAIRYFSFKELELGRRQPFSVLLAVIVALMVFLAEPQIFLFVGAVGYAASGPIRAVFGFAGRSDRSLTGSDDSSSLPRS
jgi:CDP-diacylglycerol--serine O-phosphatidyltransferase